MGILPCVIVWRIAWDKDFAKYRYRGECTDFEKLDFCDIISNIWIER